MGYNIGVIGLGSIAHSFCAEVAEKYTLYACASRDINKSTQFKEKYGFEVAFDNYNDFFNCDEIDIVYISTIHPFHEELSIKAMEHKKHVLCEKPLSITTDSVKRMIDCSKEHRVLLMEAMKTKFTQGNIELSKLIKSHAFGKVSSVEIEYQTDSSDNLKLFDPNLSGGVLLDLAVYPLAFLEVLFSSIGVVTNKEIKRLDNGIDHTVLIEGLVEDIVYKIKLSTVIAGEKVAKIYCDDGVVTVPNFTRTNIFTFKGDVYEYPKSNLLPQLDHFIDCLNQSQLESRIHSHEDSMTYINWIMNVNGKK
jgi:predicted dehydrogenase